MAEAAISPTVVGVGPRQVWDQRPELLEALAQLGWVSLSPCDDPNPAGADAVVWFGEVDDRDVAVPLLTIEEPSDDSPPVEEETMVTLADHPLVAGELRGMEIAERWRGHDLDASGEVLATVGTSRAWVVRGEGDRRRDRVRAELPELAGRDTLKHRLARGRFLALGALVHFVRAVSDHDRWERPARRAAFVIDDPNLHRPRYGYIDFAALGTDAAHTGYHVAIGMVPRDGERGAHAATVRSFAASGGMSLVPHGNDHLKQELERGDSVEAALPVAAEAMRRIQAFQRRHQVAVEPVMVPPHSKASAEMARALLQCGFEAVCYTKPTAGPDAQRLAGIELTDLRTSGLPGIRRAPFSLGRQELALRGLLGQPAILTLHHWDLKERDLMAALKAKVESIGATEWCSLQQIIRGSYLRRTEGDALHLQLHTRLADVDVPDHVTRLVLDVPGLRREKGATVDVGARTVPLVGGSAEVEIEGAVSQVRVRAADAVDPAGVADTPKDPWASLRRWIVHTRDRVQPVLRR